MDQESGHTLDFHGGVLRSILTAVDDSRELAFFAENYPVEVLPPHIIGDYAELLMNKGHNGRASMQCKGMFYVDHTQRLVNSRDEAGFSQTVFLGRSLPCSLGLLYNFPCDHLGSYVEVPMRPFGQHPDFNFDEESLVNVSSPLLPAGSLTDPVYAFYTGTLAIEYLPGKHATIDEILQFDPETLETSHSFIQLLFPHRNGGGMSNFTPPLPTDFKHEVCSSRFLFGMVLASAHCFLRFLGIDMRIGSDRSISLCLVDPDTLRRKTNSGNHNIRRVSRFLKFFNEINMRSLPIAFIQLCVESNGLRNYNHPSEAQIKQWISFGEISAYDDWV